jgi:hypothetical protein
VSTMLDLIWMRPVDTAVTAEKHHHRVSEDQTGEPTRRGAELIARRGARLCLVSGCLAPLAVRDVLRAGEFRTARGPAYCDTHLDDLRQKLMRRRLSTLLRPPSQHGPRRRTGKPWGIGGIIARSPPERFREAKAARADSDGAVASARLHSRPRCTMMRPAIQPRGTVHH